MKCIVDNVGLFTLDLRAFCAHDRPGSYIMHFCYELRFQVVLAIKILRIRQRGVNKLVMWHSVIQSTAPRCDQNGIAAGVAMYGQPTVMMVI